jgi:sigma-B regulation protein RsbU (phosphoserine phosphatase)
MVAPLFDNANVIGALYVDTSKADAYTEDHLRRLALLANILAVKISNARLIDAERESERMRQEMETAARIQRALLPRRLRAPEGYAMEARLVPSTEAGGDLYEVLRLGGDRTLIAVGDVAGHGVGAALVMANAMAALRALAGLTADPSDLVSRLHAQMWAATEGVSYFTLFVGIVDRNSHRLTFVNAGHEYPALILPDAAPIRLDSTGPPVGLIPDVRFEQKTLDLPKGSLLAIWTDGITEAHSVENPTAYFGESEPVDALLDRLRDLPLPEIAAGIFSALDRFLEGRTAPDDATLFLLRRL